MSHKHDLECIQPVSSTEAHLRGRLWFCSRLGKYLEGPDPNAELKARRSRMQSAQDERLREIAAKHGLDLPTATEHAKRIYEEGNLNPLQRSHQSARRTPEKHHPAILEAWEELPGSYSYFSAASAMKQALAKNDPGYCVGSNCPGKPKSPHYHAPNEPKYRGRS